jgi:hypothetical protein
VNGVRIGNVGTPATPGFMPPTVYKRDWEEGRKIWMTVITRI